MAMTLITTHPDSTDVANVSFTSSIASTYKLFIFKFYDINPATDDTYFTFNGSIDTGSNYNVTKTTTYLNAYHAESGSESALSYDGGQDLAQSTSYQRLSYGNGNDSDGSYAGTLWLFNPSNTTYVKHFYSIGIWQNVGNYSYNSYVGGYFNTTSAIDAVDFKFSSGNMDGVIKMYGVG